MGKKISKSARDTIEKLLEEGSKTISKTDRMRVTELLGESAKTTSDADYMKRNDGGMAKKTRAF
jgi:hypothetical protein